jgi:anti-sigma factor RsiW
VDHNAASELLGVYVLDACEESEAAGVRLHISTCGACDTEAARLRELAGWLGASEAVTPSSDLRSRLIGQAEAGEA